jgi:hypothetical protein
MGRVEPSPTAQTWTRVVRQFQFSRPDQEMNVLVQRATDRVCVGQVEGTPVAGCRKAGLSEASIDEWRKKYVHAASEAYCTRVTRGRGYGRAGRPE